MQVLVVEDDRALGLFLQKGLKLEGHSVDWAGDGETALEFAEKNPPDLMVLDLGLPRRDGTEVLASVSAAYPSTSVLVLTGRSHVDERIRCLNAGADDCLLKPFSFHELAARCRAILRRRAQSVEPTLRFGALEMDRLARVVRRSGIDIECTAKEFALLEFLMMRRGEVCTREQLLREVWQMDAASNTNVVDVYVNYLRRKLAVGDALPSLIETVRGQGYRLAVVKPMAASTTTAEHAPLAQGA